ncbi:MAG: hypothetical protein ABGZ53_27590 [Fuerstiella sp.]
MTTPVASDSPAMAYPDTRDIVFLTRGGCVNTPVLRANLDAALSALGIAVEYTVVDQGTLPSTDVRCGYPTPTIRLDGRDVFDMPAPSPPFPPPT